MSYRWEPRLLTRAQAAYHCGVSETEFLEEVAHEKRPPIKATSLSQDREN